MSQVLPNDRLERFLRLFAKVENREGVTVLLLVASIFLVLTAYYFIKPVREGWLAISVLQGFSKLEVKAYSAFAQSLMLFAVLPAYAWLATRWPRRQLMVRVGGFFGVMLVVFWLLQPELIFERLPYAGIVFYLFVGIFSVTLVAQFWSFASDLYGPERGKRLFPLVAVGASAGAVAGSWIGEQLLRSAGIQAFDLILLAIVPLAVALWLAARADRRGSHGDPSALTRSRWQEAAAPQGPGAYRLIASHGYLAGTALLTLTFSWVVASGDNILFGFVQATIEENLAGQELDRSAYDRAVNAATTAFYGNLYFWINLVGLLLQAFLVSRILRYAGFGVLMLTTPLVSLAAYGAMLATPILGIIKIMKIAENSSNYSVNNTARHILWLPTTKQMLYQAKPTIDTLFVRLGDGLAAVTVLVGTRIFSLDIRDFVAVNLVLVVLWIGVATYLVGEHRRWSRTAESGTYQLETS